MATIQPAPEPAPQLVLRASTLEPYVGQRVQLTLDIIAPAGAETPRLDIPWLLARPTGFAWALPPEQWLCQRTLASDGLAIQVNNWPQPLRIPVVTDSRYRLDWWLVVGEPESAPAGGIVFRPVQLHTRQGSIASNPVRLRPRRLPLPRDELPAFNLGVGNYQVRAAVEPATVRLGGSVLLTLQVSGKGALEAVPPPVLTALPPFRRTDDFRIEDAGETWTADGKTRSFRYRLWPRRTMTGIPPLLYVCFDPDLGVYQTRETPALALTVLPAETITAAPPRMTPSTIPERWRLAALDDDQLRPPYWSVSTGALVFLAAMPCLCAVLIWLAHHRHGRQDRLKQWHRSNAARHALQRLAKATTAAVTTDALSDYLRQRFHVSGAELTGSEAAGALALAAVPEETLATLRTFYRQSDAARFGSPDETATRDLRILAEKLVKELDVA